jgi:hypothetical protein
MIDLYLNQNITLKIETSVNEYNEPVFTLSTIKARFEYDRTMVKNKEGEEVVSEAKLFTLTPVKVDDVINYDGKDYPIISVANMVNLEGELSHYEARL